MKWGALLMFLLAACRSPPPERAWQAPTTPPSVVAGPMPALNDHRLVGCREVVLFPTDSVLKDHAGQPPLVRVSAYNDCGQPSGCSPAEGFALWPDGLFVYEGPACGLAATRLIRHLDERATRAARSLLSDCARLPESSTNRQCSHGIRRSMRCQTAAGALRAFYDDCGDALGPFARQVRRVLDVDQLIADPASCARAPRLTEADVTVASELDRAVAPKHRTECTYEPQ